MAQKGWKSSRITTAAYVTVSHFQDGFPSLLADKVTRLGDFSVFRDCLDWIGCV
jgi:hypothetical protein